MNIGKHKLIGTFVIILCLLAFSNVAHAKSWHFVKWVTDIAINSDSSFLVRETQTVQFEGQFSFLQRGIALRKLNKITDIKVYDANWIPLPPKQIEISHSGDEVVVRISFQAQDEVKSWIFEYKVLGGLGFYKDFDELSWNAISEKRAVSIDKVIAVVHLPQDVSSSVLKQKLFIGPTGSKDESSNHQVVDGHTIKYWGENIGPYVNFTIAAGFPKGIVQKDRGLGTLLTNTTPQADESLMKKYEPFLFFHKEEVYKELFYPMNIDVYLNKCSLWYIPASGQDSKIKDEGTVNAELLANLAKTIKDNDKLYLKFVEKRSSLEMMLPQENWDYTQDALVEYLSSSPKYTYYFRQFIEPDCGYLVLQYWFFYAFNSWGAYPFGYNTHEGDWESITLFLHPVTQQPVYAGYSAHHDKENKVRKKWNEIRKTGTHPMVFVALGSHANYFEPKFDILTEIFTGGVPETPGKVFSDRANATGMIIGTLKMEGAPDWHEWENRVILEDETHSLPDWARFYKGKWGMDAILGRIGFDGPKFPSFESDNEKYYHPAKWAGIIEPPSLVYSTNFMQGQQAKVISDDGLKLRNSHEIVINDSNKTALINKDDVGVFCISPKKVYFRVIHHYAFGFCLIGVFANS